MWAYIQGIHRGMLHGHYMAIHMAIMPSPTRLWPYCRSIVYVLCMRILCMNITMSFSSFCGATYFIPGFFIILPAAYIFGNVRYYSGICVEISPRRHFRYTRGSIARKIVIAFDLFHFTN